MNTIIFIILCRGVKNFGPPCTSNQIIRKITRCVRKETTEVTKIYVKPKLQVFPFKIIPLKSNTLYHHSLSHFNALLEGFLTALSSWPSWWYSCLENRSYYWSNFPTHLTCSVDFFFLFLKLNGVIKRACFLDVEAVKRDVMMELQRILSPPENPSKCALKHSGEG